MCLLEQAGCFTLQHLSGMRSDLTGGRTGFVSNPTSIIHALWILCWTSVSSPIEGQLLKRMAVSSRKWCKKIYNCPFSEIKWARLKSEEGQGAWKTLEINNTGKQLVSLVKNSKRDKKTILKIKIGERMGPLVLYGPATIKQIWGCTTLRNMLKSQSSKPFLWKYKINFKNENFIRAKPLEKVNRSQWIIFLTSLQLHNKSNRLN